MSLCSCLCVCVCMHLCMVECMNLLFCLHVRTSAEGLCTGMLVELNGLVFIFNIPVFNDALQQLTVDIALFSPEENVLNGFTMSFSPF